MFDLFDTIEQKIREILTNFISGNLNSMFLDVNERTSGIAGEVGRTPQQWNQGIYSLISTLSENVMIPIAGMIIAFVLCYELITMITEKNNMQDMDIAVLLKWCFKVMVAVYLVNNSFVIVMAVFDVGQHLVQSAAGVINQDTFIDTGTTVNMMLGMVNQMEIGELLQLSLETMVVSLCLKIISILITVVLYGRMIEIFLYVSVAPVPMATITNREWGQIGTNYVRGLLALGFQGFFIMVVIGIYCVLLNQMTVAANVHSALFSIASYTVILCFALFKTGSVSRSIMNAH